jgi:hypothetical protein
MMRAAGACTSTAILGRWPGDRLGRSSQGLPCDHWLGWEFGASPVDRGRGNGPAVRAEIRRASQRGRFRSRWHAEVATTGLLVDERAQARAGIEDRHGRRGHARRSVGANIFKTLNDGLIAEPVTPSAPAGSAAFVLEINTGKAQISSSTGSLELHIVIVDPRTSSRFRPASQENPISEFLLAWSL